MLCNVCKENEATVHLTQMIEGKIKKVDLCETCSKSKGVDDPTGFSLADLLLGLGAAQESEPAVAGSDLSCPQCGHTQADFKKSGRLGCPRCYEVFREGLEGLLKSMHKGTKHVGKVPLSLQENRTMKERLKALQGKLEAAVSREDFESAAMLRDEIRQTHDRLQSIPVTQPEA